MLCPFCSNPDTWVIDSRPAGEGNQIRRRRECSGCSERFTTYEVAELNFPRIIKSDGGREPFSEEKLRGGILRAMEKRPVATERIDSVVSNIMHKLRAAGDREVESVLIGNLAMEQLRAIDQVAYIRFASVYRSFNGIRAFLDEIERLEHELPPELQRSQLDLLQQEDGEDN